MRKLITCVASVFLTIGLSAVSYSEQNYSPAFVVVSDQGFSAISSTSIASNRRGATSRTPSQSMQGGSKRSGDVRSSSSRSGGSTSGQGSNSSSQSAGVSQGVSSSGQSAESSTVGQGSSGNSSSDVSSISCPDADDVNLQGIVVTDPTGNIYITDDNGYSWRTSCSDCNPFSPESTIDFETFEYAQYYVSNNSYQCNYFVSINGVGGGTFGMILFSVEDTDYSNVIDGGQYDDIWKGYSNSSNSSYDLYDCPADGSAQSGNFCSLSLDDASQEEDSGASLSVLSSSSGVTVCPDLVSMGYVLPEDMDGGQAYENFEIKFDDIDQFDWMASTNGNFEKGDEILSFAFAEISMMDTAGDSWGVYCSYSFKNDGSGDIFVISSYTEAGDGYTQFPYDISSYLPLSSSMWVPDSLDPSNYYCDSSDGYFLSSECVISVD